MFRNRLKVTSGRKFNLYLFPVIVAPFVLLSPVFLTGKSLFWGTISLQFVPWRFYAWEVFRSGHLPLWNPLNGMGAPLMANYQSALFYPPNWIHFILQELGGIGWAAWGQALLVAAHLAWAGLGMALLGRRIGLGSLAQSISGLAYGLSGYLVARSGFLSINAAASWIPWVILAGMGILDQQSEGEVATQRKELSNALKFKGKLGGVWRSMQQEVWGVRWLVVALALQLMAGHAQITWYTMILCVIWMAYHAWRMPLGQVITIGAGKIQATLGNRLWNAGVIFRRMALALILAFGLAAVQLVPTAEYLLQSQRGDQVDYEYAMTYSFWPWRFTSLLAPDWFGNPIHGDYWGYGNFWEDTIYIGLLPFIMALFAVIRKKSHSKFLVVLIIASFLLALGKNTPIYPWLYRWVPTFAMFQAPTRFSIWGIFALSLLAGMGVEGWKRPTGRGLYWTRLGTAGALAVMIGAGLAWYLLSDIKVTFLRATSLAGFWGVGTGLLTLIAPPDKASGNSFSFLKRSWPFAVVSFVMVDLLVAGWGLNPGIKRSFYNPHTQGKNPYLSQLTEGRIYISPKLEYDLKFKRFMRFDTFQPDIDWSEMRRYLLPNLNLLDNVQIVNNFDPLVPGRYARWMEALDDGRDNLAILNLMSVSMVEKMELEQQDGGVRIEDIDLGARLRWVPCAIIASDEQAAWEKAFSGKIDFNKLVVLESKDLVTDENCTDAGQMANIQIVSEHPNRIAVKVQNPSSGWLVLSDVWYPGWNASINSVDVPIWRANYLFRAVKIGVGEHEVIFSYQPISFYSGVLISFFVLLIIWAVWRKKR